MIMITIICHKWQSQMSRTWPHKGNQSQAQVKTLFMIVPFFILPFVSHFILSPTRLLEKEIEVDLSLLKTRQDMLRTQELTEKGRTNGYCFLYCFLSFSIFVYPVPAFSSWVEIIAMCRFLIQQFNLSSLSFYSHTRCFLITFFNLLVFLILTKYYSLVPFISFRFHACTADKVIKHVIKITFVRELTFTPSVVLHSPFSII